MAKKKFQDRLLTQKSAYFFQKHKPLSKAHIKRIFKSVMEGISERALQSGPINKAIQVGGKAVKYSFMLFREKYQPPFLDGTKLSDVTHGYLLICELPSTIAVFKSHAHFVESDLEDAGTPIEHADSTRMFMVNNAKYERISARMMTMSNDGIHTYSQAALDLERSMSMAGTNRAIPTGFQINAGDLTHTVSPNTGRISQRDVRSSLYNLLAYAIAVEEEHARPKPASGFIDHFAGAVKLSNLPAGVEPRGIIFPLNILLDGLEDGTLLRIQRIDSSGNFTPVDTDQFKSILELARQPIEIVFANGKHMLFRKQGQKAIGELKKYPKSYSVDAKLLKRFYVEKPNNKLVPLSQFVNLTKDFLVTFSDPSYAYHGGLYRDHNLLNQLHAFMSVFQPVPQLSQCTTEKGEDQLTVHSTTFPITGIFGVITNHIATADQFLVYDDLNDEWADAIGVCTTAANPSISFYAAKHKAVGLGAKSFQDVIGQAVKNLSHRFPTPADLAAKQQKWGSTYNHAVAHTQIPRLQKGASVAATCAAITSVLASPISRFRMCLVISFISKAQLAQALTNLKNTGAGSPELIQLLWFVTGFITQCRQADVAPYIYCQP